MAFWDRLDKPAFFKALIVHVLLVAVALFSFHTSQSVVKPKPVPQHIRAVVVEKPKPKPRVKKKSVVKKEKKKVIKKKVKKKPKVPPKKKRKEKVKPKTEKAKPKPKPKPEPKVDEPSFEDLLATEAKKIKEPPVKPKLPLVDKAAEQEKKERAEYVASEVSTYSALISQTVRRYWNRPPSARNGMQVMLKIRLLPGGELNSVSISRGSGNAAFDRAAVNAVERAGNFTVPADAEIFDKHFREFSMLFNPEDLKY